MNSAPLPPSSRKKQKQTQQKPKQQTLKIKKDNLK